jgi:RNA polymerase sigma factor (TIGR02999 family)
LLVVCVAPGYIGRMADVTNILDAIQRGDANAAGQLWSHVYDELRRLAAAKLRQEKPGHTLDGTALVHEAYLRLVGKGLDQRFDGRGHFFATAAEAMRRILVENARRKKSLKRGGAGRGVRVDVDVADAAAADAAMGDADAQILALDEALSQLTGKDALAARVVELHHFGGLSHDHVAEALGITIYLTRQKWNYARAWLKRAMADS